MIYRIDIQHFLTHAIDHFTRDDLVHFQYAIISAAILNGNRATNVAKINELYPTTDIILAYEEYKDKKILEKMYSELILPPKNAKSGDYWAANSIYKTFINPLMKHHDIVILCDEKENDYIDVLCKLLKKHYSLEVIDLNQLFKEGRVGSIYIDRDEINDKAVDIRRQAGKEMIEAMASTKDGKLRLIQMWNKKEKIAKLKSLGIKVTQSDMKNLNEILIDEWVNNDNDEDDE